MDRTIEAVGLSIYLQTIHDNITKAQADKLVSTISTAWKVRNVPFDVQAFEVLTLKGLTKEQQ